MGLKSIIPGTAEYSKKHHKKYLRKRLGSRDFLLLVEWADKTQTEMPAKYRVEDNTFVAKNGMRFKVAGKGAEPIQYYGVPCVRVHALVACPFDATSCIHAELDEENEYEVIPDRDGQSKVFRRVKEGDGLPSDEADGPQSADGTGGNSGAVADGGHIESPTTEKFNNTDRPGDGKTRVYDMQPPDGCIGWAFRLDSMAERVVNAIPPTALKDAEERGKQKARQDGVLRQIAIAFFAGVATPLAILAFLWILARLVGSGGGGGGGGGGVIPGTLLLLAIPAGSSVSQRVLNGLGKIGKANFRVTMDFFKKVGRILRADDENEWWVTAEYDPHSDRIQYHRNRDEPSSTFFAGLAAAFLVIWPAALPFFIQTGFTREATPIIAWTVFVWALWGVLGSLYVGLFVEHSVEGDVVSLVPEDSEDQSRSVASGGESA